MSDNFEQDLDHYLNTDPRNHDGARAHVAKICRIAHHDKTLQDSAVDCVHGGADRQPCVHLLGGGADGVRDRSFMPEGMGSRYQCMTSRRGRNSSTLGELVLSDSGASCEVAQFPPAWDGHPPPEAEPVTANLAAGVAPGFKNGERIYMHPDLGSVSPVVPWGRFSRKWQLTGGPQQEQ